MKQITLFRDGAEQWASRFKFIDNIDIDVVVTKVSMGYITAITVIRGEYKDGCVLCDSLDRFDVYIKASDGSGAASIIDRNHLKLQTAGKPERLTVYKFDYDLHYEE